MPLWQHLGWCLAKPLTGHHSSAKVKHEIYRHMESGVIGRRLTHTAGSGCWLSERSALPWDRHMASSWSLDFSQLGGWVPERGEQAKTHFFHQRMIPLDKPSSVLYLVCLELMLMEFLLGSLGPNAANTRGH